MALPITGEIANIGMLDTLSVNPDGAIYPPMVIGGIPKALVTIQTTIPGTDAPVPIIIIDQVASIGTHLPVLYSNPPVGTPLLIRPSIVPVQNTSVFMEGNLVPITGDGMVGVPAVPNPRIIVGLTSPTIYPRIKIGTNPLPIPTPA